ncbi:MAG: hypothetical protein JSS82_11885 [Bacteroidetes bacterium]|nr:hypothetical protein [Bacteroidota bacterium]
MRFVSTILITATIAFLLTMSLPWWMVAVAAFIVALLLPQRLGRSFLSGFLGIFLFWLVYALLRDVANDHILSTRMAKLFFHVPGSFLFLCVAALVGGLVGGLGAWTGAALRSKQL